MLKKIINKVSVDALIRRIKYIFLFYSYKIKFQNKVLKHFQVIKNEIRSDDKCLIIANGPSIKNTDLSKYTDYKVITLNRAYVKWNDLAINRPFLHIAINDLVIKEFKTDLIDLRCNCIYAYNSLNDDDINKENILPILMGYFIGDRVNSNIALPFSSSGTVTFVAFNIALLLGFKEIVVVGLDHNFHDKGDANKKVTMQSSDQNHFFNDYFPKGMTWQLPDLQRSEKGYKIIKQYADDHNVCIFNESTFSKCDIFQRR